jgi:glycosyltransferase involved in cell wall biosynthesis
MKTAIVVPCYNEADRLKGELFLDELKHNDGLTYLFVNDGSSDNTQGILDALCAQEPSRAKALSLTKNSGKAEAVRKGILKAFEDGFDYVGYLDADLSTSIKEIMTFTEHLERDEIQIVMGSRVKLLGREIERKASRHYLGRFFATYASFALNLAVYDTQCGAKMFRNTDTIKKVFSDPFITNWVFDVEMLARYMIEARKDGEAEPSGSIVEAPLMAWRDVGGSKLKLSHIPKIVRDMLAITFRYTPTIYKLSS